jgi:nucleoside-diphosphate-sugar epimerase
MPVTRPTDEAPRKRALVTGIGGFTGRYVAAELSAAGYEVIGLTHAGDASAPPGVHAIDLCDRQAMMSLVSGLRLDVVIHLAAISFVAHGDADAIYRVNVVGTRNLLEALDRAPTPPRVVVLASSANVYGNATAEPITEQTPPAPTNDYAVSKLAMEYMARVWMDRLPIVITRPFNYTGVGQSEQFLLPKIVSHFARGVDRIELGNLDVLRDFMDVRDVARCYRRLVEITPCGQVVNLCSGNGFSLHQIIEICEGIARRRIKVEVNPSFVRANEVKRLIGSRERANAILGEFQLIDLQSTLQWMMSSSSTLGSPHAG